MDTLEPYIRVPGWPIQQPNLAMRYRGRVLIVMLGPQLSHEAFAFHVKELEKAIDHRAQGDPVGVFYHSEASTAYSLDNVRMLSEMLKPRRELLRATTAGFVMCTSSVINRTAIRLLGSLAPPPYPQSVVKSIQHGYDYLGRIVSGMPKQTLIDMHIKEAAALGIITK
jgi:hypothetical protein